MQLDLAVGTRRCSGSFCWKSRFWKAFAMQGDFRPLQGEDALSDCRLRCGEPKGDVHQYFCRRCSTRPSSKGCLDVEPFNGTFHAVNIATLDDATDSERSTAQVQYGGRSNGRDGAPEASPGRLGAGAGYQGKRVASP